MRNPGLTPGMDPGERRRRIASVLPKEGEPWAPPNRAAAMWLLIAEALENDHDVAGAVLVDAMSENGTVRCLRLAWRADLRNGWGAQGPILHLDATLRPELVNPFIPEVTIAEPLMATEPHVRVRQILRAPVSAKALTPGEDAKPRDRSAAENHRRQVSALIALRAASLRGRSASSPDLLIIAQKEAVDALRAAGLPRNVQAIHFNALSGIDRWRSVAGLMVLGRTLPAPVTVEALAAAVTNCPPLASRGDVTWWYELEERRIALADGGVHALSGETHVDPTVEAIRWTICEGELIQAIGRGRGVNRTAATPLEVDLLTDVVLPVAVHEVLNWDDVCPSRQDMMAASGVVLENAADMARAFPDLWPSHDAARQQKARSVTSCYYRDLSNSRTSHSSSVVAYRLAGPGQKDRTAQFDLVLIPDPRAWLEAKLGPLAHFEMIGGAAPQPATPPIADARARLTALSARLDAALTQRITNDRAHLTALSHRMEAAQPNPAAA
jgi:putative DNA primase/helicase